MVRRRVETGVLRRVHRGAYAVGPMALPLRGRLRAASVAAGQAGVVSHRAAALLWEMLRGELGGIIDVTASRRVRSVDGVRVHHSRILTPADITTHYGIPVTTPARILLDLAAEATPSVLARAVHEAEVQRIFDLAAVDDVLARANGRRGTSALQAAIADWRLDGSPHEGLEEAFAALLHRNNIERPELNGYVDVGNRLVQVDALWRRHRLIVELDGRATHLTRRQFEEDRLRDQQLTLAGYRVVRFTYQRLTQDPEAVLEAIRALLQTPAQPAAR
jgi:very-short-patch-repair endonuclease